MYPLTPANEAGHSLPARVDTPASGSSTGSHNGRQVVSFATGVPAHGASVTMAAVLSGGVRQVEPAGRVQEFLSNYMPSRGTGRSVEYKAFQRNYSSLRDTFSALGVALIAHQFKEKALLSKTEIGACTHTGYDPGTQADKLLEALERRILADCGAFKKMIGVLNQDPVYEVVTQNLVDSYNTLRQQGASARPYH